MNSRRPHAQDFGPYSRTTRTSGPRQAPVQPLAVNSEAPMVNLRTSQERLTRTRSHESVSRQDAQQTTSGSARKRISVACGRCRKRKIKCSGDAGNNRGCQNCQSSGETEKCHFTRVGSTPIESLDNNRTDVVPIFHNSAVTEDALRYSGLNVPASTVGLPLHAHPAHSFYGPENMARAGILPPYSAYGHESIHSQHVLMGHPLTADHGTCDAFGSFSFHQQMAHHDLHQSPVEGPENSLQGRAGSSQMHSAVEHYPGYHSQRLPRTTAESPISPLPLNMASLQISLPGGCDRQLPAPQRLDTNMGPPSVAFNGSNRGHVYSRACSQTSVCGLPHVRHSECDNTRESCCTGISGMGDEHWSPIQRCGASPATVPSSFAPRLRTRASAPSMIEPEGSPGFHAAEHYLSGADGPRTASSSSTNLPYGSPTAAGSPSSLVTSNDRYDSSGHVDDGGADDLHPSMTLHSPLYSFGPHHDLRGEHGQTPVATLINGQPYTPLPPQTRLHQPHGLEALHAETIGRSRMHSDTISAGGSAQH